MKTLNTFYRINLIRSKRACEREGIEPKMVDKHIGDFEDLSEAMQVYESLRIGMEVDKQLLYINEDDQICIELKTTF